MQCACEYQNNVITEVCGAHAQLLREREMSTISHLRPKRIGTLVHDNKGAAWIYIGYRVTTTNSKHHTFVRALDGGRADPGPPWTYSASTPETLKRKFPDLFEL